MLPYTRTLVLPTMGLEERYIYRPSCFAHPRKATRTVQLHQENIQRQAQVQRLAPHLIQANTLLQCSTLELQQLVEQEQQENPALDCVEEDFTLESGCRLCPGRQIGSCANCPFSREGHPMSTSCEDDGDTGLSQAESQAMLAGSGNDTAEDERQIAQSDSEFGQTNGDEGSGGDYDPLLLVHSQTTLADQLLLHLRASAESSQEKLISEYLVDSLDERGWLQVNIDEACAVLRVSCGQMRQGIERLQACDPAGVGARDLQECLLLQMRHLREGDDENYYDPLAFVLLSEHWTALIQHRQISLARRLGIPASQIEAAMAFIKKLNPNPAASFRPPWDHRMNGQSKPIHPDVMIKRSGTGFTVEVLGFENTALQINPYYRNLYDAIKASRTSGEPASDGGVRLSADHQKHVMAYVERANMFLKNLQQRRRTIQKITLALVENQQGFLETGQRSFLRPFTRTLLARQVDMHESTVSRALLYKYVQLPSQDVVSFDIFFENAVTIKDTIASLVEAEVPGSPLSDRALVDALAERGLSVARRTVVKYREEMRISASYMRRRQ